MATRFPKLEELSTSDRRRVEELKEEVDILELKKGKQDFNQERVREIEDEVRSIFETAKRSLEKEDKTREHLMESSNAKSPFTDMFANLDSEDINELNGQGPTAWVKYFLDYAHHQNLEYDPDEMVEEIIKKREETNPPGDLKNLNEEQLMSLIESKISAKLTEQVTTNLSTPVDIPEFGQNGLSDGIEKSFKNKFGKVYYKDRNDNSSPLSLIMDSLKSFVELHDLSEEAAEELLMRLLQKDVKIYLNNQTSIMGLPLSKVWINLQSLGANKMTPNDAVNKIENIIKSPPDEILAGIMAKILEYSLLAHSNVNKKEKVMAAVIVAKSKIFQFILENYGHATRNNVQSEYDLTMRTKQATNTSHPMDDFNTLYSIAVRIAGNLPMIKKKVVEEIRTGNGPASRKNFNNWGNGNVRQEEIKRCYNCGYQPRNPNHPFFHTTWRECKVYLDDNGRPIKPDFNKPRCQNCFGYHKAECRKPPSSNNSRGSRFSNYGQNGRNFDNKNWYNNGRNYNNGSNNEPRNFNNGQNNYFGNNRRDNGNRPNLTGGNMEPINRAPQENVRSDF